MCGLAGFVALRPRAVPVEPDRVLGRMADALHHRGPDSGGVWSDAVAGAGLAHRRLAILDLSSEGHQPMRSASGRYVVAFNGEIYNFLDIKQRLIAVGCRFRGTSDTEVLLAAVEHWGVADALPRLVGMFAFALWDAAGRTLHLARDRLGKKPLYLAVHDGVVLFASELKALRAYPGYAPELDDRALSLYTRYAYIPDPWCIYAGALKLPAGASVALRSLDDAVTSAADILARCRPYWSLREVAEAGCGERRETDPDRATEALARTLEDAVDVRMLADVPIGAFLSGGIDSSLVVALMQSRSSRPVKTFTMGFEDRGYDEARHADRIARHLGTEHTSLTVTAEHTRSVIPELADIYDEPFADPSQIPTTVMCRLARSQITVALSGDGGDESFGGYDRHVRANWIRHAYRVPHPWRATFARGLGRLVERVPAGASAGGSGVLPSWLSSERLRRVADVSGLADCAALYEREMLRWPEPSERALTASCSRDGAATRDWAAVDLPDDVARMMYVDSVGYLPGDILVKLDRASMAASLEVRSPLLDHRVVEAAWRLPLPMKVHGGRGKWVLREILSRYVPPALYERPKQGFATPIAAWLRGPLRDWAEDALAEDRLRRQAIVDTRLVRRAWAEHLSGTHDHSFRLWTMLMLQAWLRRWMPGRAT